MNFTDCPILTVKKEKKVEGIVRITLCSILGQELSKLTNKQTIIFGNLLKCVVLSEPHSICLFSILEDGVK